MGDRDPWISWQSGTLAHPNSPAGGTGTGSSRPAGFGADAPSGTPHPNSPAARNSDWYEDFSFSNLKERVTQALKDLDSAPTWNGLLRPAGIFLSENSFDLGVCYGVVENAAEMAWAVLSLGKTFVLASLYDAAHLPPWAASPVIAPGPAILIRLEAKVIEMFFGDALKTAHDQRDKLLDDLRKAIAHPIDLIGSLAKNVQAEYTAKWNRLQKLLTGQPSLSGNFEAGKICGEVLFDILMLITAIGDAAKLAKLATEIPELVRAARGLKEAAELAGKLAKDEAGAAGRVVEEGGAKSGSTAAKAPRVESGKAADTVKTPAPQKLTAGSPEHKAARWKEYQERGGSWDYDRWSKQYETNMKNPRVGLAREREYRAAMNGENLTIETPFGDRQVDIYIAEDNYMGQLKTGKEYLTKDNIDAIRKDAWLVDRGYKVEYILEKGASKPFLNALDEAKIVYKIGPQIP